LVGKGAKEKGARGSLLLFFIFRFFPSVPEVYEIYKDSAFGFGRWLARFKVRRKGFRVSL